MSRRFVLPLLVVVTLLFTGCSLFSAGPDSLELSIELTGDLGATQELLITSDKGRSFVVDLGTTETQTISLESGNWFFCAYSRDDQGDVVSQTTSSTAVQGGGTRFVVLTLSKTRVATTEVRAENLSHTRRADGAWELTWESLDTKPGTWEVWARPLDDLLWQKVGQTSFENRSFRFDLSASDYVFGVRFLPLALDGSVLASPLAVLAHLEVNWAFQHDFPVVKQAYSTLGTRGEDYTGPQFTDLVAHFKSLESFEQRDLLLAQLGLAIKGEIPSLLAVLVEPDPTSPFSLDEWSVYEDASVYLEPNWIVGTSSIAGTNLPWYLDYIRLAGAHSVTQGSVDVNIAVLDTGLNPGQLGSGVRVVPGYNFSENKPNEDTLDVHSGFHGTKVARSITHVAKEVTLQPVKVFAGARGTGTDFSVSEGLLYAAGLHDSISNPNPAQIINMSLGGPEASELMRKRVEWVANNSDALMIAASGNTLGGVSAPGLFYPAGFSQVIAVGSVSPSAGEPRRASYSHWGSELDLVAPPTFEEGTSFSSALVSGVAGLMLANGMDLEEIRASLLRTAIDLGDPGFDLEHGHGLVNAHWAVLDISRIRLRLTNGAGEVVQKKDVPLGGTSERFMVVPGEYVLEAWLNLQGATSPQAGDYFAVSEPMTVGPDQTQNINLTLREIGF